MKKELVFVEERKQAILDYVLERKKTTVQELCERFAVSSATIRTDLRDLERNGLLVRTHGGAMVHEQARFEPDAAEKLVRNAEAKRAIAALALARIEDGDTLIIDTGSTTLALADVLDAKRDLTVLTNDLEIAGRLERHPSATVHLIGGLVRKRFHCTVGAKAEAMLAGLTVDKAFMGANCFSLENGASTPDLEQSELKRRMIEIAASVYLLVDSSKIGRKSFARFAAAGDFDCLLTDGISAEDRAALEELGVEVLIAEPVAPL
jgi:DeoR family fructose operon transcriptional repressor